MTSAKRIVGVGSGVLAVLVGWGAAAAAEPLYDEAKVPAYELPDPLLGLDGKRIEDAAAWTGKRRAEVLGLFEEHVYGRIPATPVKVEPERKDCDAQALGGLATRKQYSVKWTAGSASGQFDLLLWLPNEAKGPVPAFAGLNFFGNHSTTEDPAVWVTQRWVPAGKDAAAVDKNRATGKVRGEQAARWPVEMLVRRGYAVATAYCGDFEPDHAEGWKEGVRAAFSPQGAETKFAGDAWGAIGAWAWGLSRVLDALEKDPAVDAKRVAVIGHSRLGKTALWAGATDPRFAIVVSNESGEGGAAIARRRFGETTAVIQERFPHWFCGNFRQYSDREDKIPVDQHQLLALIAPRPLYVASAEGDRWADPKGEFLAAVHAGPVYQLFGKEGLGVTEMPPLDTAVGKTIGYHIRRGPHDITEVDWKHYLDFADRHADSRK